YHHCYRCLYLIPSPLLLLPHHITLPIPLCCCASFLSLRTTQLPSSLLLPALSTATTPSTAATPHFPVPLRCCVLRLYSCELLNWTDQQRAAAAKEGWSYRLVFSTRL
ncbi:hypothetical protein S83_066803, partial [Arachis hypogaea]